MSPKREECPVCGGSGGAPVGWANPGWDVETYECVGCGGAGCVQDAAPVSEGAPMSRPGIAKTSPAPAVVERKKQTSGR
jgi:hypothetical protein